ncbi:MAG: DUF2996 domain-containing protein [Cyanobacteria bacterium P01_A01_bin.17]
MADDEKTPKSEAPAEKSDSPAKAAAETAPKSAAKAKKEKPPAVEDKPFADFIQQDYLPALESAFAEQSVDDIKLDFIDNQVTGSWQEGQRQFTVYFPQDSIKKQRAFSWSTRAGKSGIIEPFLIDERKITLDLLVFGVMQRLNAQKWLGNN